VAKTIEEARKLGDSFYTNNFINTSRERVEVESLNAK